MNKSHRIKASKHEDGADLISNLPDHLLLSILSGLPSTEEIIRTSILSRRWRYLWTSIPSLDLVNHREGVNLRRGRFTEFVDYVLSKRSADLDSFRLSRLSYYRMSTIERWIQATVMRNVKRLDLTVPSNFPSQSKPEDLVLPHCLVTCASLEELRLCFISRRLILPSFSGFPALRVLNLKYVELLDDDLVKGFLESCPMLEDLTLDNCSLDKLDRLCISCTKLKKLRILETFDLHGCLKISCPKLVFLVLTSYIATVSICERPYSLKEAIINIYKLKDIHRLYPGISHVESLTTNFYILYEYMNAARDPGLPNLKTLELTATNDVFSEKELIRVLKHCPKLESLSLRVENDFIVHPLMPEAPKYGKLDESEAGRILTPDVKWIEFFEINGKKPKLLISGYPDDGDWYDVVAMWGEKARYLHKRQ